MIEVCRRWGVLYIAIPSTLSVLAWVHVHQDVVLWPVRIEWWHRIMTPLLHINPESGWWEVNQVCLALCSLVDFSLQQGTTNDHWDNIFSRIKLLSYLWATELCSCQYHAPVRDNMGMFDIVNYQHPLPRGEGRAFDLMLKRYQLYSYNMYTGDDKNLANTKQQ